jgi:hypothetical protein
MLSDNHHGPLDPMGHSMPDGKGTRMGPRPPAEGRDLTNFLNNLVKHIRSMSPSMVCFDDNINQDVIITAVLKGWKSLSRYQRQCPLWAVLQMVDQTLFKDCNLVERISVLRMLHMRYLSEVNLHTPVEGPLPPWFTPQYVPPKGLQAFARLTHFSDHRKHSSPMSLSWTISPGRAYVSALRRTEKS